MDYTTIPQESKAEILESTVINGSAEEIAAAFKELGHIEMTARALGLACRYREAKVVRTLIEHGASFDFPKSEELERRYHCYSGMKYHNYRSDFSLYLLNITKQIKGACCCKGLKLAKQAARRDKTFLKQISDNERGEVLRCLVENAERISFEPSEMLYYAIFTRDNFIVTELKKINVKLSDTRINFITNGGPISDSYWYEWLTMTEKLENENYLPVMKRFAAELDGRLFHCTGKMYDITKKRFVNAEILEFFLDNFKTEKLNKTDVIRGLIDCNAVNSLPTIEKPGWLDNPKRRDEMIEYSQSQNRTECTAWLLDFKNRTADLAAERKKADKRAERELNASPTSVTMMKKIWSFKKQDDNTLIITNYKGNSTEVIVPDTIGKSPVTAIGNGAFAGSCGKCGGIVGNPYSTLEQQKAHRAITKITLPQSVRYIDKGAFGDMLSLTEINIPDAVTEIGDAAFYECRALAQIILPRSIKHIGEHAFRRCDNLTAVVTKGSYAEDHCKKHNIRCVCKED